MIDVEDSGPGTILRLSGRLTLSEAPAMWKQLDKLLSPIEKGGSLDFDLSKVESVDGAAMAMLVHARGELVLRGVTSQFVGATGTVAAIVRLYHGDGLPEPHRDRKPEGLFAQVGRITVEFMNDAKVVLGFVGDLALASKGLVKSPRTGNWREVAHIAERTGADAVPIVLLINFLIGFVMAYQGSIQLKEFGANLYVADLVGLSVTRELGPLMTAIIVCGRSGAAFAAEIGSMTVAEEIDALRTMGFGPIRHLVLPRVVALVLVMPVLTLLGDFVGMFGGLVVGVASLDLTVVGYWFESRKVIHLWDVFSGVIKSVVFAIVISMISCQQGFATTGGAEGVGRRTTSAVVTILFSLILVDATFTVLFHMFGL